MKQKLLLALIISSGVAYSQVTVTSSDLPSVGSQQININDMNLQGFDAGNPGANQTYDFFLLQNTGEDTTLYLDPASTPFASNFPNSTMVMFNTGDSSYTYLNLSGSDLIVEGMTMPNPLGGENQVLNASDPLKQFQFPMTYQNSFTDQGQFATPSIYFNQMISPDPYTYFDSIQADITIDRTVNVDGWGTFLSPFGYEIPVLRVNSQDITAISPQFYMVMVDTVFGVPVTIPLGWQAIPGTDFGDTTTTYYYVTNVNGQIPMIVAQVEANALGVITSASYAKMTYASINELNLSYVFVTPNPSSGQFKVESTRKIEAISVYSLDGKEILSITNPTISNELDLSKFESGVYSLVVKTELGTETKKIQKL
jgi:hypothetical protein